MAQSHFGPPASWTMTAVQLALAKAAARAQRHAELDAAKQSMEKLVKCPLDPESLPWGAALSLT